MVREDAPREEPPREEDLPEQCPRVDKGKRRAYSPEPSERTPLLGASTSRQSSHNEPPDDSHPRRTLRSTLTLVFLVTFSLSVLTVALLALLAYSYAAQVSRLSSSDLLARALVVQGPDLVSVLNLTQPEQTEDGRTEIWVMVHGRAGFDAGKALGVRDDEDPDTPDAFPTYVWKAVGRWGIRCLHTVSVQVENIHIASAGGTALADVDAPTAIELPLTGQIQQDNKWLHHFAVPMRVRPTDNGDDLINFAKESWNAGFVAVSASVGSVHVVGGGNHWGGWRRKLQVDRKNIEITLKKQSSSFLLSVCRTYLLLSSTHDTRYAHSRPRRASSRHVTTCHFAISQSHIYQQHNSDRCGRYLHQSCSRFCRDDSAIVTFRCRTTDR
jgi:hypothetical protein